MKNNIDVSVIVPVYNVEEYLEECLDSLVGQSIGVDRLQVILINNASSDKSLDIMKRYAKQYACIEIIDSAKNLGPAGARNLGIDKAKGEFISFVDSDDFIDLSTYEHCISLARKFNVDQVIYSYKYFSPSNKIYPLNPSSRLFPLNRTIKRSEIAQYPELMHSLGPCNKLIKASLVRTDEGFPGDMSACEDGAFAIRMILASEKIYVTDFVTYYYRKRENENSTSLMDRINSDKTFMFNLLKLNEQLKDIGREYRETSYAIDWVIMRSWHSFLERLISGDTSYPLLEDEKKDLFNRSKELYHDIDPGNSYLDIDNDKTQLALLLKTSDNYQVAKSRYNKMVLAHRTKSAIRRLVSLPKKIIQKLVAKAVSLSRKLKPHNLRKHLIVAFEPRLLSLRYKQRGQDREVWLVGERGVDARDNGLAFFEFLQKTDLQNISVYYVIKPTSDNHQDIAAVKRVGKIVETGSKEHKKLYTQASTIICTHSRGNIEPWEVSLLNRYNNKIQKNKKYVFLQHGVTKDNLRNTLGKEALVGNFDLFICGAKPEWEYIKKTFGYENDEVQYTGFSRYDKLPKISEQKLKNQILIMPTWRSWGVQKSWDLKRAGRTYNDSEFLKTDYYIQWQQLLNDQSLNSLLEGSNIELIFYPHFEVQQYLKYFSTTSEHIVIASKEDYDVATLLRESKLLVTDFSSVFFDFAYMGKPTIFYQFDTGEYNRRHYQKGYFDYRAHGFGPVVNFRDDLVNEITDQIGSNLKLSEEYSQRIDDFFTHKGNNSKKIFDAILDLHEKAHS